MPIYRVHVGSHVWTFRGSPRVPLQAHAELTETPEAGAPYRWAIDGDGQCWLNKERGPDMRKINAVSLLRLVEENGQLGEAQLLRKELGMRKPVQHNAEDAELAKRVERAVHHTDPKTLQLVQKFDAYARQLGASSDQAMDALANQLCAEALHSAVPIEIVLREVYAIYRVQQALRTGKQSK